MACVVEIYLNFCVKCKFSDHEILDTFLIITLETQDYSYSVQKVLSMEIWNSLSIITKIYKKIRKFNTQNQHSSVY